jgi:cyclin E
VTCLFIGAKIEEIYPPKLNEFSYVTDGACSDEEILAMELVVLKELNWGLSPMTPNAWMKMYMQVANVDRRADSHSAATFVTPQFTGLPFCRVMQLVDLCVLDMKSLSFSYSVLAASALALVQQDRDLASAVSGYDWQQLAECARWMEHFYSALKEDGCVTAAPRTFHNVQLENAHNIQTHATEVRVLDSALDRLSRVQKLREQELSRLSPDPSSAPMSVDMTPPDESGDVRMYGKQHKTPTTSTSSTSSSSVFLSPESPAVGTAKKTTLYSSLLKQ